MTRQPQPHRIEASPNPRFDVRYRLRTLLIALVSLIWGGLGVTMLMAGMYFKQSHPDAPMFAVGLISVGMITGGITGLFIALVRALTIPTPSSTAPKQIK
jgi:Na+/glutamate symporter